MSSSKSNNKSLLIGALVLLLGLSGYLWYSNKQLKDQLNVQTSELNELEKVNAELDQDYQSSLAELEEFRGENKELNQLIDSQKKELQAQKDKINNLIWTKRELNKAKDEISKFEGMVQGYVSELNTLKAENERLEKLNKKLEGEKVQLTQEVNQTRANVVQLEEAKAMLVSESNEMKKSNEVLSTKVDMAEAIKINWMEVKGYEVKDNGKLKKKSKGKDMDMIRTCFRTESNYVASAGTKTFQVRLIDPQGETVFVESSGSGVLTNKLDGTKVRYTGSGTVEYNNEDTEGCVDWMAGYQLAKGMYDVEIYNNGFMVGKGDFKVK